MGGKRDDGVVGKIKAGSPGLWYLPRYIFCTALGRNINTGSDADVVNNIL